MKGLVIGDGGLVGDEVDKAVVYPDVREHTPRHNESKQRLNTYVAKVLGIGPAVRADFYLQQT